MSKRRTLFIVWNYLEWGGAQIYFLGIMKLAKDNWDVTVVLPAGSDEALVSFIEKAGARYRFLDRSCDLGEAVKIRRKLQRKFRNILSEIEVFKRLSEYKLRDSIVHIEAAPWQSMGLLTALALRGSNTFVTFHNGLPEENGWRSLLWRFKLGLASRLPRFRVFASNQETKDRFRRWMPLKFWETIRVTYTTVNPDDIEAARRLLDRDTMRQRLGIPADSFVILCLGQFIDRKGRWVFMEAAKKLLAGSDSFRFVWVTASVVESSDQEKIRSFDLGENFRLISSGELGKERTDILSAYLAADVFALPSYVEGLPIALLEAMAMGVPSISTNVFAIPEAIVNGETGLLIEPGNADELADAILRMHASAELRARLAERGREFVLRKFDERAASEIAIDAYDEALADA